MPIFANTGTYSHLSVETLLITTIYAILGVIILLAAYKIFDIINPLDFDKELANNNTSLAIVVGSFFISMAIIIASAIFG